MTTPVIPKPLNAKAYGHIMHLPGSRMGPGDHRITDGQAKIAAEKARDADDLIIVTVKLDGTCMAVARIDDTILPLMRAGYVATTSKYEQHQLFAQWVYANQQRFLDVLANGERFVGEWLAQAHGTRYSLKHGPFVVFDLMVGPRRLPFDQLTDRAGVANLPQPSLISMGGPTTIDFAKLFLEVPMHGELDTVEGAVWRVERKGEFDFICKWVRPDKLDGRYLPEVSGEPAVWNWRPFDGDTRYGGDET